MASQLKVSGKTIGNVFSQRICGELVSRVSVVADMNGTRHFVRVTAYGESAYMLKDAQPGTIISLS